MEKQFEIIVKMYCRDPFTAEHMRQKILEVLTRHQDELVSVCHRFHVPHLKDK